MRCQGMDRKEGENREEESRKEGKSGLNSGKKKGKEEKLVGRPPDREEEEPDLWEIRGGHAVW